MCRLTEVSQPSLHKQPTRNNKTIRILYSLESFGHVTDNKKSNNHTVNTDTNKKQQQQQQYGGEQPHIMSCLLTGGIIVLFLFSMEYMIRYILVSNQTYHTLFTNEMNRIILARHLGVDVISCCICVLLGLLSSDLCTDIWQMIRIQKRRTNNTTTTTGTTGTSTGQQQQQQQSPSLMNPKHYNDRLYSYHAGAFRLSLFFFFYQIKNLYDTIKYNDGIEFIMHHVLSLLTAYGSMYPGCGPLYCIFFFGISEISTAVLCLLANFDDDHGVQGLGTAFPLTKVTLGGIFFICFLLCRCFLWPIFAYYFAKDVTSALREKENPQTKLRQHWMKFFLVSVTLLSVLQIAWLGQIFLLGKQELEKIGLL